MNSQNGNSGPVIFAGVTVRIEKGHTEDYLQMRARQLAALAKIATDEGFGRWNRPVQADVICLMNSLASEVHQLIPLAIEEAKGGR